MLSTSRTTETMSTVPVHKNWWPSLERDASWGGLYNIIISSLYKCHHHIFSTCSIAPELSSHTSAAATPSSAPPSSSSAPPSVPLDPAQPTTSIQIRLSDGSRLVAKFNPSHTINDIRQLINMYPLRFPHLKFYKDTRGGQRVKVFTMVIP